MATLPLPEAILLEIHQSLGLPGYPTGKKTKFATGQDSLESHKDMGADVLHAIFEALDLDPQSRVDVIKNFKEFSNAYKFLELHTWTFAANQRQILWALMGHFFIPGIARHVPFWSLGQALDKGMPGGRFWYLPEPREVDGKASLSLPVAQVVDWLLDLLDMPLEKFADQRSESTDGGHDGLRRSLYNWRTTTPIRPDTIQKYFADDTVLHFSGAFLLPKEGSHAEQIAAALDFVKRKGLTADRLRLEIPMTRAGRVEAILDGRADEDEQALFVECLVDRYSAPSLHTIRQRLLLARMMQDGYLRLLKFLCPGVDPQCADGQQNKLLQLLAIYKFVYNLTVDAWRNCQGQGRHVENAWFENHLPTWDRHGLFLSILPSRKATANQVLALLLTRRFYEVQGGDDLEDHIGLDAESALPIMRRSVERATAFADELNSELHLVQQLKGSPPWPALQAEHRYWVVSQSAQAEGLSTRAKEAAIQRLRDLAATPAETVQAILFELDGYLNGERNNRPKDTRVKVQSLLDEAKASDGYVLWKAAILQYEAKHLLACNDFDGAGKLLREALEAGRERNYGLLRGEVARDCLAVDVANQKLIANNHEKYYREMLAGGMMGESEEIPTLEETARWASGYFWETLYKPYPDVRAEERLASGLAEKLFKGLMPLLSSGSQEDLQGWINGNRHLLKSSLPDVDGNSVLMILIKMRTHHMQRVPLMRMMTPPELQSEIKRFETMLEVWRQFLAQLAKEHPRQLNLPDLKGQTPLMLMSEAGDAELVSIMLQAGADPEMQDLHGMTALHSAIKSRVDGCVNALLDHPCQPNNLTRDGQSPLHTASWTANLHAVKRLLQMAPELAWQRNSQGATPLEQVEFLIENPDALKDLNERRAQDGKRFATKQELMDIAQLLEQAIPCRSAPA